MFIEFADFPTSNRNHGSTGVLISVPILKLEEIQGGHAGIEMKMKRCLASRLTVGETGKLLGILEEEFNLNRLTSELMAPSLFQNGHAGCYKNNQDP